MKCLERPCAAHPAARIVIHDVRTGRGAVSCYPGHHDQVGQILPVSLRMYGDKQRAAGLPDHVCKPHDRKRLEWNDRHSGRLPKGFRVDPQQRLVVVEHRDLSGADRGHRIANLQ